MSVKRSKRVKNLEEAVESIFSQDESDEINEIVLNDKQKITKTPSKLEKTSEISTPICSQDLLQTPRRSCRKSVKPAQDYEDIVKRSLRSCKRSEKETINLEYENGGSNGDENAQPKWTPAKVGRVSQKRGRKSKRFGKGKGNNDKEIDDLEQSTIGDKRDITLELHDKFGNEKDIDSTETLETPCVGFEQIKQNCEIQVSMENNQVDEIIDNMGSLNVKHENGSLSSASDENISEQSENLNPEESEEEQESSEKSEKDKICIVFENNISKLDMKTESEDEIQSKSSRSSEIIDKDDSFGCYLKAKDINISDLGLNPIVEEEKDEINVNDFKKSPHTAEEMPSLIICDDDDDENPCLKNSNLNTTFEANKDEQAEECPKQDELVMETLQMSDDDCETPSKYPRKCSAETVGRNPLYAVENEACVKANIHNTPKTIANELPTTPTQSMKRSAFKTKLLSTPTLSTPKLLSTPQRSKTQYRFPTPYRNRNFKSIDDSKENVHNSPNKILSDASMISLTTMEPKEIVLRGIRKRSLSVCINEKQRQKFLGGPNGKPKQNRVVSFHSPANQTTIIDDLDNLIKKSLKKNKLQQKDSAKKFVTTRRKRSLSLDESIMSASFASKLPRPVLNQTVVTKSPSSSSFNTLKRTKLPNFAAIHERQFNKMENLIDHVNRKQERSKNLINSATKSMPNSAHKTLKSLPDPRSGVAKVLKLTGSSRKQTKDQQQINCLKPSQSINIEKKKTTTIPKKPAFNLSTSLMVKPTTSALNIIEKVNTSHLNNDDKIATRLQRHMDLFKGRAATRRAGLDSRKNDVLLKGVRSNRRFELQMQHRKNLEK